MQGGDYRSDWLNFLYLTFKADKSHFFLQVEPDSISSRPPISVRGNTKHASAPAASCSEPQRLSKLLPKPDGSMDGYVKIVTVLLLSKILFTVLLTHNTFEEKETQIK